MGTICNQGVSGFSRSSLFAVILVVFLLPGLRSEAAIPLELNHQGVIQVSGTPFEGMGAFRFALLDRDTGLNLWTNDLSGIGASATPTAAVVLQVQEGVYSVRLGNASLTNMNPIPSTVFNADKVDLRIWFDDQLGTGVQLLSPDVPITSVPFAYRAGDAETLGGESPSDFHDAAQLTGTVLSANLSLGDSDIPDTITASDYLPLAGGTLIGAVTTSSTFDGRDIFVDGAKLDSIETGAAADQTASEIATLFTAGNQSLDVGTGSLAADAATIGVVTNTVTLSSPLIQVPSATIPIPNIERLYNSGGNLFWSGVQLDATPTVTKDRITGSGALGFDWQDSEVDDALTISSGGSVDNGAFSAYSDLGVEGYLDNDATGDLLTRTQSDGRYLQSEADTLDSVVGRGASTNAAVTFNGGITGNVNGNLTANTVSVGGDAAFALQRPVHGSSAGTNLTLQGQNAAGTNQNGGDLVLTPGSQSGTGNPGAVVITDKSGVPASTANRLYNNGGNLFWNGTQLDSSGGGSVSSLDASDGSPTGVLSADAAGDVTLTQNVQLGNSADDQVTIPGSTVLTSRSVSISGGVLDLTGGGTFIKVTGFGPLSTITGGIDGRVIYLYNAIGGDITNTHNADNSGNALSLWTNANETFYSESVVQLVYVDGADPNGAMGAWVELPW